MVMDNTVNVHERRKADFPRRIRELRVSRGLRQRAVAEAVGINPGTYGNVECNGHKTVRIGVVHRLAKFYGLDDAETAELVRFWEALPASQYNTQNTPEWNRRAAARSKARAHDGMRAALLEVTTLLVTSVEDPDSLCVCTPDLFGSDSQDSKPCEICNALIMLGLTGWTGRDDVITKLALVQEGGTK